MKKLLLTAVLLIIVPVLLFSQFYEKYDMSFRKELAEAYYLVGQQYESIGKKDKGSDFKEMAFLIYPELKPEAILQDKKIIRRAPKVTGTWKPRYSPLPPGVTAENAVKYQFTRFLRFFFTEDTSGMLAITDTIVYGPAFEDGISRKALGEILSDLFSRYPIEAYPPSQILELQSITVEQVSREIWKTSVRMPSDPAVSTAALLNINSDTLTFYFRQAGDKWKLFSYEELPRELEKILNPEPDLKKTIISSVRDFVDEDLAGLISWFTEPFTDIPNGKNLNTEDLLLLFGDYFRKYDFAMLNDIRVEMQMEETVEVKQMEGRTYKVYFTFLMDDEDFLPFWGSYRGCYLVFDEDMEIWKIRAIF